MYRCLCVNIGFLNHHNFIQSTTRQQVNTTVDRESTILRLDIRSTAIVQENVETQCFCFARKYKYDFRSEFTPCIDPAFRAQPIPTSVFANRIIVPGNPILTESLEIDKRCRQRGAEIESKPGSNSLWEHFAFPRNVVVENLSALCGVPCIQRRCKYNTHFHY